MLYILCVDGRAQPDGGCRYRDELLGDRRNEVVEKFRDELRGLDRTIHAKATQN